MSTKRLLLSALGVFVVVFAAAVGALQVDRWLRGGSAPLLGGEAELMPAMPVQLAGPKPPFDFTEASQRIIPSVVSVDNLSRRRSFFGESRVVKNSSGSGVIVSSDGYILTNNHVVEGAAYLRVKLSDDRVFSARLVGRDPRTDLALVKVDASGLKPALYGDSTKLKVGQWVMAVGSPLGYDQTLSVGVVSSLGRTLPTEGAILIDTIQTDASINQGNSGGALCTYSGELIGINTAIASTDGGSIGLGFSIPIHRAKRVVDELRQYGKVRYGAMGLNVDEREGLLALPEARQELMKLAGSPTEPPSQGLLVRRVSEGSPAFRAGMRDFTVLMELDGKAMNSYVDMQVVMLSKKPGDRVKAKFWTAGQTKTADLTLVEAG